MSILYIVGTYSLTPPTYGLTANNYGALNKVHSAIYFVVCALQSTIFFIFSGVLYAVTVIFAIMGFFYKYVEPRAAPASESGSTTGSEEKAVGDIKIAVFGSDDVTSDEKPPLPTYEEIKQDADETDKEKEIEKEKELAESLEKKLDGDGYTNVALDDNDSDSVKF
jgi:hypothetical protein